MICSAWEWWLELRLSGIVAFVAVNMPGLSPSAVVKLMAPIVAIDWGFEKAVAPGIAILTAADVTRPPVVGSVTKGAVVVEYKCFVVTTVWELPELAGCGDTVDFLVGDAITGDPICPGLGDAAFVMLASEDVDP